MSSSSTGAAAKKEAVGLGERQREEKDGHTDGESGTRETWDAGREQKDEDNGVME
jgi:hypothetical protein